MPSPPATAAVRHTSVLSVEAISIYRSFGSYRFMQCHFLSIIRPLQFFYVNLLHLKH
jgi:hypothetical protein